MLVAQQRLDKVYWQCDKVEITTKGRTLNAHEEDVYNTCLVSLKILGGYK